MGHVQGRLSLLGLEVTNFGIQFEMRESRVASQPLLLSNEKCIKFIYFFDNYFIIQKYFRLSHSHQEITPAESAAILRWC